jgi:hypothetical protein
MAENYNVLHGKYTGHTALSGLKIMYCLRKRRPKICCSSLFEVKLMQIL